MDRLRTGQGSESVHKPPPDVRGPAVLAVVAVLGMSTLPAAAEQSCAAEIGWRSAERLVERCLDVSPATHPPCNAENSCAAIRSEIERGCALIRNDSNSCEPN